MIVRAGRGLTAWVPALQWGSVFLKHMASWDSGSSFNLLACHRHQRSQTIQPDSAKGVWVGDTAHGSTGALERVGPVKSQPVPTTAFSHSFWVCHSGDEPGLKAWVWKLKA